MNRQQFNRLHPSLSDFEMTVCILKDFDQVTCNDNNFQA